MTFRFFHNNHFWIILNFTINYFNLSITFWTQYHWFTGCDIFEREAITNFIWIWNDIYWAYATFRFWLSTVCHQVFYRWYLYCCFLGNLRKLLECTGFAFFSLFIFIPTISADIRAILFLISIQLFFLTCMRIFKLLRVPNFHKFLTFRRKRTIN